MAAGPRWCRRFMAWVALTLGLSGLGWLLATGPLLAQGLSQARFTAVPSGSARPIESHDSADHSFTTATAWSEFPEPRATGESSRRPELEPPSRPPSELWTDAESEPQSQPQSERQRQPPIQPLRPAEDPSDARLDPLHRPLPAPSQAVPRRGQADDPAPALAPGAKPLIQTGIALGIVLLLLFGLLWFMKKATPKSMQGLPLETIQVLGNAPLTGRQHLRLIRLGERLLLLAVSDTSAQTLTEITDPDEVRHLLEQCRKQDESSLSRSFQSIFQDSGRQPASGFLGSQHDQLMAGWTARTGGTDRPSAAGQRPSRPGAAERDRAETGGDSRHIFEA